MIIIETTMNNYYALISEKHKIGIKLLSVILQILTTLVMANYPIMMN